MHKDITLEDFQFTLSLHEKGTVTVEFSSEMEIFNIEDDTLFRDAVLEMINNKKALNSQRTI